MMPVEMHWHPSLPVLQATYTGTLSSDEYYAMCDERLRMLEAGPEEAILVADTCQFEGFPDALTVRRCAPVTDHSKVVRLLVVLGPGLYRTLRSCIEDTERFDFPVRFFADLDAALRCAADLIARV